MSRIIIEDKSSVEAIITLMKAQKISLGNLIAISFQPTSPIKLEKLVGRPWVGFDLNAELGRCQDGGI